MKQCRHSTSAANLKFKATMQCCNDLIPLEERMVRSDQMHVLFARTNVVVKVLDRNQGQKWLGCMLTAAGGV